MCTNKCTCPVCHSDEVHGFKEHDGYEWWSECISGKDHGRYVLPDGSRHEWPEQFWFSESGWLRTRHGRLKVHCHEPANGGETQIVVRNATNSENITNQYRESQQ